jgi:hypothetical protein
MVRVTAVPYNGLCISSGSSSNSISSCSRYQPRLRLSIHTWIMIVTGAIVLCLFRIESIIYDEIFYHGRETEEVRVLRYKQTNYKNDDHDHQYEVFNNNNNNNNNNNRFGSGRSNKNSKFDTIRKYDNNDGKPVARNGFISRGSLRTPMIITSLQQPQGSSMTFDHFEIERMEYDVRVRRHAANSRTTTNGNKMKNLLLPRIIELDDRLNVITTIKTTTTTKSTSTMELKYTEQVGNDVNDDNNDNDDNDTIILDFERPWHEECEPVLTQPLLPIVHPTCNGIHELPSLTTLDIDSSLLSMKGSWRSVWKVNNDENHQQQQQQQQLESDDNTSTSDSFLRNETTSRNSSHRSVVLKMLHLHRQFDRESFEAHATDVMVMDRLTASPHVVNAYGFCGQSVVTEFAELSGRDFVKRYDIGSQERLRVARDLARGLADIQALQPLPHDTYISTNNNSNNNTDSGTDTGGTYNDTPDIPIVFAHNDITIANTVMIDGRIKWNDFNIGVFVRRKKQRSGDRIDSKLNLNTQRRHERLPSIRSTSIDKNENKAPSSITTITSSFTAFTDTNRDKVGNLCPSPVKYRSDLWRSPEEIKNTSYVQLTQSDMYGLGNILYQTMTRHQPWSFKEPGGVLTVNDVAERKMNGTVPTIPEQYLNTTKRSLQTMFAATNICYYSTPSRRPTARRLAYGLGSLYNKIKHKERVTRPIILDYLVQPRK